MHASMNHIVTATFRIAVMTGMSMLLILGILPAVLAAQAGRN
jgi:hypothetical protein